MARPKKATTAKKTTAKKAVKKTTAKKAAPKAKTAAAKKTTTKKTTAKKTTVKKAADTNNSRKLNVVSEAYKKSQLFKEIAEAVELTNKQVQAVFAEFEYIMHRHLKKRSIGEFTIPGLAKFKVVRKPATKARKGINPFTGEETTFQAKPARNVVKIRPLKKVKEMAEG